MFSLSSASKSRKCLTNGITAAPTSSARVNLKNSEENVSLDSNEDIAFKSQGVTSRASLVSSEYGLCPSVKGKIQQSDHMLSVFEGAQYILNCFVFLSFYSFKEKLSS